MHWVAAAGLGTGLPAFKDALGAAGAGATVYVSGAGGVICPNNRVTGLSGRHSPDRFLVALQNGTQGAPVLSDSGDHQMARILSFRGAVASGDSFDSAASRVEAVVGTARSCGAWHQASFRVD